MNFKPFQPDKVYCDYDCKKDCELKLRPQLVQSAQRYQNSDEPFISIFSKKPECFKNDN